MGRHDWYRKSSWSPSDQKDFETRFKRTYRRSRAQYLRIQALYLAEAGLHEDALKLLERLLSDYPEPFELAGVHNLRAESLEATGRIQEALDAYLASSAAEVEHGGARPRTRFVLPLMIARHRMRDRYHQALDIVEEAWESAFFAVDHFELFATLALIQEDLGDHADARLNAERALGVASREHSGIRRHPTAGLVRKTNPLLDELRRLAE